MSTVITQLSYSINEKLCIEDRNFAAFQQRHKQESPATPASKTSTSCSYSSKDPCPPWIPAVSASSATNTQFTPDNTTSLINSEKPLGSSGALLGVAHRLTQRTSALPRREPKPANFSKAGRLADTTQVTLFDLQDVCSGNPARSTLSAVQSSKCEVRRVTKTGKATVLSESDRPLQQNDPFSAESMTDTFPSVVGVSCTLHSPKKPTISNTSGFPAPLGIPPNKRHCRSVSEPDELSASALLSSYSSSHSAWKPTCQSRVWMPIRQLQSNRRAHSAYSNSSSFADSSRSLDCSSAASVRGDPLLTPPASPVPRPASVTVIKQESGSWTFLSSQHPTPAGCYRQIGFSPLASSGGNVTSPTSVRSTDGSSRSWSNGLSATKRSLSFSDDFERTESIRYTPSSTPELNRRFDRGLSRSGGLLRCQSHPSDLNLRRTRRRNHNRQGYQRPALDFAKMKQTSLVKRSKSKPRDCTATTPQLTMIKQTTSWPAISLENAAVNPLFTTAVTTSITTGGDFESGNPLEPRKSSSPPFVFTIGSSSISHLRDVSGRIPSPTDEVAIEADDPVGDMDTGETDLATASGGVQQSFVPECDDLDVNEIENESEEDM